MQLAAFSNLGHADQIILEQLALLSKQLAAFQDEVRERFDHVDRKLNAIYSGMTQSFFDMSLRLNQVSVSVSSVRDDLDGLSAQLATVEQSLSAVLNDISEQDFVKQMVSCHSHQKVSGEPLSREQYIACVQTIRAYVERGKSESG